MADSPGPENVCLNRRGFLSHASSVAMAGGLAAGYGTLALYAGRFVYPDKPRRLEWQVVTVLDRIKAGDSLRFESPAGELITITRRAIQDNASKDSTSKDSATRDTASKDNTDVSGEFLALSSVCPHLGCKVHWESQESRFFCPCHNGAFDATGVAIAGPPKEAGQSLKKYDVRVDANGVVFVLVPTDLLS